MHRLPSRKAIWRLRFAALLLWMAGLSFVATIVCFAWAIMERSREQVDIAISVLVGFVIIAVTQWLVALQTKCPLCLTPVLGNKSCAKNKKAKTFLGSYRLRVANSILMRNYFRCQYCSEPTELVVRPRHSRR